MAGRLSARMLALASLLALAGAGACRDTSRFSSKGGRFEGPVVPGAFVRAGVAEDVRMCVSLDTEHLQDTPGTIATSDGRFRNAALRPIPQLWHDPLSTLSFGDGRLQNLVYAAAPDATDGAPGDAQDVMVFVSFMHSDDIEVRLVRGAPQTDAAPPPPGIGGPIFGVFTLQKAEGPCAF